MSEDSSECSCVVDCAGLHEIAMTTSNNLKTLYLDQLSAGVIGVPAYVWQEFEEIYPDDAASLESYITLKIKMKKAYHVGAASIADKIHARLSLSPYDGQTDLYAASVCSIEKYKLLTTLSQLSAYHGIDSCEATDLVSWAESLGTGAKPAPVGA